MIFWPRPWTSLLSDSNSGKRGAWYLANIANFLCLGCHLASTLLPLYWKQCNFLDQQIGWLAAGFSTTAILTRPSLGRGLERWGRKPFLLLGAVLLTLPAGLYSWAGDDYSYWAILRLLQGAGLGCYIPAILTWVADMSPPDKIGEMQGIFGVSGLIGSAVGPWSAELVYKNFGFTSMFQALCGAGVCCLILLCLLPESRKSDNKAGAKARSKIAVSEHKAMLWVTLPFGWFVGTVLTFIAPFLKQIDLPKVGLYFASFAAASVCVRVFASQAIDKTKANTLVFCSGSSLVLSGFILSALAYYDNQVLLITAAIFNGLGHGFLFPCLSSHTVKKTSAQQRGAGLSLFTGAFDLGILLGALASGYIAHHTSYSMAISVGSVLLFISLPVFSWHNKERA